MTALHTPTLVSWGVWITLNKVMAFISYSHHTAPCGLFRNGHLRAIRLQLDPLTAELPACHTCSSTPALFNNPKQKCRIAKVSSIHVVLSQ